MLSRRRPASGALRLRRRPLAAAAALDGDIDNLLDCDNATLTIGDYCDSSNGECGTWIDLDNCYDNDGNGNLVLDVYRVVSCTGVAPSPLS